MYRLQRLFWLTGVFSVVLASAAQADVSTVAANEVVSVEDLNLSKDPEPSTTVKDWMAQIEASLVQVTGVRVETTGTGLSVLLETADGTLTIPTTTISGNSLTANIPNVVLSLPEGDAFQQANPALGINQVSVTRIPGDQVRVEIVGTDAPPVAEVTIAETGLVFAVTPGAIADAEDAAVEITVTAEEAQEDEGYNPSNSSTATRTDTPLPNIPQSIQVVPRQVFEDQQAQDLRDITRNVSGVFQGNTFGGSLDRFVIRGFQTDVFLRDGFRDETPLIRETANLERVEVLKGPASVLHGFLEPGGIINLVTKQPLEEPFYSVNLRAGSFETFEPSIDLSGPLNSEGTVLYRLNALYENRDVFRDFDQGIERIFVAPTLTWQINDKTDITFNFEYLNDERPFDRGLFAFGDGIADIPFDRVLGELDDVTNIEAFDARYRFEHRISDNWKVRNGFSFNSVDTSFEFLDPQDLNEETGILTREFRNNGGIEQNFSLQTNVTGEFTTGPIEHTLLFGVDLFRDTRDLANRFDSQGLSPSIDIFNPEYGLVPRPASDELLGEANFDLKTDTLGIYLQDQIKLSDQWQLLVGGRFDIVNQSSTLSGSFFESIGAAGDSQQQEEAFSPRVGIVYQPIEPVSLYANFTQSFVPNSSVDANGDLLAPERGTQYEVGVKVDFLDGNLSATLAAFNINKTNIAVSDPDLPGVSQPIGEQRSRGIELDVRGEILPGWNVFGSYAYTDAEITGDNGSEVEGNRLFGVPEHAASLWTTYEIQEGDLQGLGFGAGLFFVGEREGDTANSFQVPSYTRTDASIFYRRDNWRAGINFQNLFDVDFIESADSRERVNVGIPFTVLASFSIEF